MRKVKYKSRRVVFNRKTGKPYTRYSYKENDTAKKVESGDNSSLASTGLAKEERGK